MKKYIGVISGIIFALSIGIASAQITGGGVQVTCIRYNQDGTCAQTAVSANVQTGSGATGGVRTGTTATPPINGNQQVSNQSSIVRGQTQRQSTTADLSFVTNLLAQAGGIISMLPKLLMGVAVVMFFVFLIRFFIIDADKAEDKQKAVKGMGYSLAAIFVMVTLWGIIAFFGDAIGLNPTATVYAPQLPK